MTVVSQIANCLVLPDTVMTCLQIHKATGIKLQTLSSELNRLVKKGKLIVVPDYGPRGGNGYRRTTDRDIELSLERIKELLGDLR